VKHQRTAEEYRALCEFVEESFRTTARREGAQYRIVCRCDSSKTGRPDHSMAVRPDGRFFCHRCGEGGKLRDPPDPGAVSVEAAPPPTEIEPPEGFVPLGYAPGTDALTFEDARAYAAKRHLTPEVCRRFDVGAVASGYYAGRIVIPVLGPEREWTGFVARDWTGRAAKPYLYNKGFSRARFWNHAAVHDETDVPLLVVEGVLDAVPYWPDGIAMLGKLSGDQMDALRTTSRPVALVFDGDAWREARATAMELRELCGRRAGWVRLPPRVDPDEVDFDWMRQQALDCLEEPL
jgi:hypothetical protein